MTEIIKSHTSEKNLSEWCDDELLIEKVREAYSYGLKDISTVKNAIRNYAEVVNSGVFLNGNEVIITKEKLDSVLSDADRLHSELVSQSISELPVRHDKKCSDCEYYSVCTKDNISVDAEEDDSDE